MHNPQESSPLARARTLRALGAIVALGGIGGVLLAGLGPAPAQAHNYIVSTNPAADSTVTEQPGTISITTNDALLVVEGGQADVLQVSGPGGYYGDGCTTVDGPSASMSTQLGEPGLYTVVWQVVSTDGHPVSGQFSFTWQPSEGQELATASAEPPVCGQAVPDGSPDSPSSPPATQTATPGTGDATTAAPAPDAAADAAAATAVGVIVGIACALAVLVIAALIVVVIVRRRSARDATTRDVNDGNEPRGS